MVPSYGFPTPHNVEPYINFLNQRVVGFAPMGVNPGTGGVTAPQISEWGGREILYPILVQEYEMRTLYKVVTFQK